MPDFFDRGFESPCTYKKELQTVALSFDKLYLLVRLLPKKFVKNTNILTVIFFLRKPKHRYFL